MNQYDFQPPHPGQNRALNIAAGLLLAFSLAVMVALLNGCADKDPAPTLDERLQGAWQRNYRDLTNRYNFHAGACDVYAIIPAQPVQYYAYAYATSCDTLTMLDLGVGERFVFVVEFPTDSTAILSRVDGLNYFLLRI